MNIQILPNWCKKLGLLVFIVFVVLAGSIDFIDGWNDYQPSTVLNPDYKQDSIATNTEITSFSDYFGSTLMHLFNILSIVGMIIYMMSREKIEDDYISKLRLDSYQLSTLLFLFTCIIVYIVSGNLRMPLDYFINIFILLYLTIFFIKKRIY